MVLLAAVVCTLATGVEDDSSAHLVVQLAEDTMVDTNLIQIGESKIQVTVAHSKAALADGVGAATVKKASRCSSQKARKPRASIQGSQGAYPGAVRLVVTVGCRL